MCFIFYICKHYLNRYPWASPEVRGIHGTRKVRNLASPQHGLHGLPETLVMVDPSLRASQASLSHRPYSHILSGSRLEQRSCYHPLHPFTSWPNLTLLEAQPPDLICFPASVRAHYFLSSLCIFPACLQHSGCSHTQQILRTHLSREQIHITQWGGMNSCRPSLCADQPPEAADLPLGRAHPTKCISQSPACHLRPGPFSPGIPTFRISI